MRMKCATIPRSLLLSGILASLVVLTSAVVVEAKHVTFDQPVKIGNIQLRPGTYSVEWYGTEPEVQVTFKRGGKPVATVPARLVREKNPDRRLIERKTMPDNSEAIARLWFKNKALVFEPAELSSK